MERGFAKQNFLESYKLAPWLGTKRAQDLPNWPLVNQLLSKNQLSYLNYLLTLELIKGQWINQNLVLFICHLLMAAQEGHLCVEIRNQTLFPTVKQLWMNEAAAPLSNEELENLTHSILQGSENIPVNFVTAMDSLENSVYPNTPICMHKGNFYLQKHWVLETVFLKNLKKHLQTPPTLELNRIVLEQHLNECVLKKKLLLEQAQAILTGCLSSLSLITGGPGTGKTFTAGRFIQIYWDSLKECQKKNCQIALAAPTGKAAANLQKSLSLVTAQLKDFPPLKAKTLHQLLGINNRSRNESGIRLAADLIIVDESSMIDVKMMAYLFEALKKGSRLILLGDQHQLPSVEAGSLFADLTKLKTKIPCTELKVCLRTELSSIVSLAHYINQGKGQETLSMLNETQIAGISRLNLSPDRREAQKEFVQHVMNHFPLSIKVQDNQKILELFNTIRILSPMRKGYFGVDSINQLIWNHVSQIKLSSGWLAIPIIIVTNDYKQNLFNGETGVLIRKLPLKSIASEDYALFPSKDEGENIRCLPACLLPKYELAYCLSVHKSQGSEFERVILMLPEGSECFGREVFYTGVTRARKHIEVWGADFTIERTISQQSFRLSGIQTRLEKFI
ncbi:exodeoxyribonuclease V subunit alpha [Candidatus Protochlamydia sp. R18]|uniref:exodeoxyribonuclease V subunit alpha n=1 Tax=Candidatus Protochlamydia sp. R18 TaxID=1353977 RepID=UPI0006933B0E|nr:exodeoxyribonuclease V subunit alpha [Candidatus Protochlamydia sp. R18]